MTPEGRLPGRKPPYRCKSAVSRGQPKVHRDVVEQAEVRLRDLFVESSAPVSLTPGMPAADAVSFFVFCLFVFFPSYRGLPTRMVYLKRDI